MTISAEMARAMSAVLRRLAASLETAAEMATLDLDPADSAEAVAWSDGYSAGWRTAALAARLTAADLAAELFAPATATFRSGRAKLHS